MEHGDHLADDLYAHQNAIIGGLRKSGCGIHDSQLPSTKNGPLYFTNIISVST